jgi:hypothetical protein
MTATTGGYDFAKSSSCCVHPVYSFNSTQLIVIQIAEPEILKPLSRLKVRARKALHQCFVRRWHEDEPGEFFAGAVEPIP